VAASHLLTSNIASLSYYAQRFSVIGLQENFQPMIREVDKQFGRAISLMESIEVDEADVASLPLNERVQQLLEQRKKEMETGVESDDMQTMRKKLSDLKTIAEQFQLIHSNLAEQIKILRTIKGVKPLSLQTAELS